MGRARRRRAGRPTAIGSLVSTAFVFSSLLAGAEEAGRTPKSDVDAEWLVWSPPPECPGPAFVRERVRSWLGGRLPDPGALEARGHVQWSGEEWEIVVTLRVGEAEGERRVRVATCGDAAEFLAVAIVLAVDPERAVDFPHAVEAEAGREPALEGDEEPVPPAERQPPLPPSPPVAPPAEVPSPTPPVLGRQRTPWRWLLGASVEGALGALPAFQIGPAAELGIQRGPFVLTVGGRYLPPVTQRPDGAVAPISYSLAAGRLGACALGDLEFVEVGPCAAMSVGALWTDQPPPGSISETVPWVDVQVGAMARFFGPSVAVQLGGGLSVPVTQPEFVVSSGETVHQPGPGLVLDLGVEFFFGG